MEYIKTDAIECLDNLVKKIIKIHHRSKGNVHTLDKVCNGLFIVLVVKPAGRLGFMFWQPQYPHFEQR